jgi:hypothetical protein
MCRNTVGQITMGSMIWTSTPHNKNDLQDYLLFHVNLGTLPSQRKGAEKD